MHTLINFQSLSEALDYVLSYYDDPRMHKVENHARALNYLREHASALHTLEQNAIRKREEGSSQERPTIYRNGNFDCLGQPASSVQTWGGNYLQAKVCVGWMEYHKDSPISKEMEPA